MDILLLAAIGAWLWWRRSMIAAGLMAALVAFEYYVLASNTMVSEASNSWLNYMALPDPMWGKSWRSLGANGHRARPVLGLP